MEWTSVAGDDWPGHDAEGNRFVWVLTRSEWPVLINLARAAVLNFQQIAKFDSRTRIIASAWEQEYLLAECVDGDEARGLMFHLARSLAAGVPLVDLNAIDREQAISAFTGWREGDYLSSPMMNRNYDWVPGVQSE